ncbi:hypothetical protein FDF12_09900 [Clostridium botulinum]|nr:hypothetical protein [Clostridium botulinum]NFS55190.1 hypothetical protein [Clostridium botulinum]NFT17685.1 hypothetical protein [Clostridium botulinum]
MLNVVMQNDKINKMPKIYKGIPMSGSELEKRMDIAIFDATKKYKEGTMVKFKSLDSTSDLVIDGYKYVTTRGIFDESTKNKILEGRRKATTKNQIIGGHSYNINNNNDIFAVG